MPTDNKAIITPSFCSVIKLSISVGVVYLR